MHLLVTIVPGSKNCIQVFNVETNRINVRRRFVPHVQNTFNGFVLIDDAEVEKFIADSEYFLEGLDDPLTDSVAQGDNSPTISSPCEGVGITESVTADSVPQVDITVCNKLLYLSIINQNEPIKCVLYMRNKTSTNIDSICLNIEHLDAVLRSRNDTNIMTSKCMSLSNYLPK